MTKMKSKKMTKSTFVVIIMAIIMVAMMAFGGTYAYFTANAIGENVKDIETAQLELINNGDETGSRLKYTKTNEIVPGQYVFGAGKLSGAPEDITTWKTVNLDLGDTNAAVYAFVKVDVKAKGAGDKTLMVKTADSKYVPVLKLIPNVNVAAGASGKSTQWVAFDKDNGGAQVQIGSSTYIYYFKVDEDQRDRFEEVDFQFALQFDPQVHSDRRQIDAENPKPEGYINLDGKTNIVEKTNVYAENADKTIDESTCVSIMGVSIELKMDFRLIQQLGFDDPADAFDAAFAKDFGGGNYTDSDLVPGNDQ